ncbi:PIN domain-containing protein [Williamsia sp. CHRR-6]|uniref:PIN domain-containing protein n=1 Tax=Williamsia sp. CHRR-6 TaxID=2835871 RepID=UPI001BDB2BEF|nr:PIN domain-containing protein [Williamsia sp. CHRR-6]MBT0566889.1 PIN domain-containing protein [Williamsia sp. CHRR-6]
MNDAIRDGTVAGFEPLVDAVELPDPGDRHVLAAAIKARAQVIVTRNLRDFPADALTPWDLEAKSPDDFILDQIDLDRTAVYGAIQRIADSNMKEPRTVAAVLPRLERDGLIESFAALRLGG